MSEEVKVLKYDLVPPQKEAELMVMTMLIGVGGCYKIKGYMRSSGKRGIPLRGTLWCFRTIKGLCVWGRRLCGLGFGIKCQEIANEQIRCSHVFGFFDGISRVVS